jgi:hypothetical protein
MSIIIKSINRFFERRGGGNCEAISDGAVATGEF